jgi:hypothetical protein
VPFCSGVFSAIDLREEHGRFPPGTNVYHEPKSAINVLLTAALIEELQVVYARSNDES